ncbi:MAG: hypothetical protein ACRC5T_12625 [Cetobacterium sp.]
MKENFTISEQIEYLENNKNICFRNEDEKKEMKLFLQRNNYLNVISLKYLFSSGQEKKNNKFIHKYEHELRYTTLKKKYDDLLNFEDELRNSILSYETELKVHLDEYFKTILKSRDIGFKENLKTLYKYDRIDREYKKLEEDDKLFKDFNNEWEKHITQFSYNHTDWNNYFYLLLKILTFGTINSILDLAIKNENGEYKKLYELFSNNLKREKIDFNIGKKLDDLKTIGILRNALCHKESLVIFLEKGFRKGKNPKIKRDILTERIHSIKLIYQYYTQLKYNSQSILTQECWIVRYSKYRLKNGIEYNFEDLEIKL